MPFTITLFILFENTLSLSLSLSLIFLFILQKRRVVPLGLSTMHQPKLMDSIPKDLGDTKSKKEDGEEAETDRREGKNCAALNQRQRRPLNPWRRFTPRVVIG